MIKIFVVGARIQAGGAYMAYHLGRIVHRHFGGELFDVAVHPTEKPLFHYDTPMTIVSVSRMEKMIGADDILIVNPSFSSFLFGLRLPGRKIMYIQGFQTFKVLDCHCDLYVSVSHLVRRYIESVYGIATHVIPAFIDLDAMPVTVPWHERPTGSALVYMKTASREHRLLYSYLASALKHSALQIDLSHVLEGQHLQHRDFLAQLGAVRYLINLSPAEGFGLVPLEAMAMGTLVTGLDGLAGRDYMCHGENCLVGSVTHLRALPDIVSRAFAEETLAKTCAAAGKITAQDYGYASFEQSWVGILSEFLGRKPGK